MTAKNRQRQQQERATETANAGSSLRSEWKEK
jgi:hypothetical protein